MCRLILAFLLAAGSVAAQPGARVQPRGAALSGAAAHGVALRFEPLGAAQGLSQSSVLAVLQDRTGFLWLGTQDGLNRYDGTGVTVYRHDPLDPASLPTSYIQTLAQSRDGAIWIGTWGGGLSRFDPASETFRHFRHDPDDPASLPDDIVTAVLEDARGRLWVGTGGGLARLDRRTGRFRRARRDVLPDPFVWSLAQAGDGALWVGLYRAGVTRLDLETGATAHFRHDPNDPASLPSDEAASVEILRNGDVWVGTGGGVARVGLAAQRLTTADGLCGDYVYDIAEGAAGTLWVGTGDGGLCRVETASGRVDTYRNRPADPFSLPKDVVRSLLVDRTGTLWVGTDGGGAARYTGASERFGHYRPDPLDPASLSHPYVWSFEEGADGAVWVGTDGGGLGRLDPVSGRFSTLRIVDGLSSDVVVALERGRDGGLWVGTFEGLDRVENGRARPVALAGSVVTALSLDDDSALWVGTWGDGLARRSADGALTRFVHGDDPASLPHDVITTLAPAAGGDLWVGTYGAGVARLDRATGRFQTWGAAPDGPLSHATVYGVHPADGVLWIATAGGGLNRLDLDTGQARVFTTHDGLPHNIVYAVLPDAAGQLWLSTNDGLAVFDPVAERVVAVYDAADGLQGDEFNSGAALRQRDGTLLFGGTAGFNRFRPDRVARRTPPPLVALTGLRRFGEPVDLGRAAPYVESVRLSHQDNFITFEFAALDYADPEGHRYRYRLDGVDDDWRETDGRRPNASYTNLPGGRYTFHVQAAGADGAWSPHQVALGVRVVPPWWGTVWARVLSMAVLLAAMAGVGAGVQRRRLRRGERERADEREAQRRLAEAREAERLRTARELHDGPLQDLYGARYRLESLEDALTHMGDGAPPALDTLQAQAGAVRETLLGASRQLRDVCAELRPPVLGPMGLGRALGTMAARLVDGRSETVTVEAAARAPLADAARVALYRVAQEAVRNALRHADAQAIRIVLADADGHAELRVTDDGCGFVPPRRLAELARHDHLGLVGAAERVEAVGGTLDVTSALGSGTTVRARVPHLPRSLAAPSEDGVHSKA